MPVKLHILKLKQANFNIFYLLLSEGKHSIFFSFQYWDWKVLVNLTRPSNVIIKSNESSMVSWLIDSFVPVNHEIENWHKYTVVAAIFNIWKLKLFLWNLIFVGRNLLKFYLISTNSIKIIWFRTKATLSSFLENYFSIINAVFNEKQRVENSSLL